jgi:glycosyltransferase involved in cell wall biosynthesis
VPVVSTRVGDVESLVEHERSGLLIGFDEEQLASALQRLASDSALRASFGRRGREIVEQRYALARVAELHEDFYLRVLARRRSQPAG